MGSRLFRLVKSVIFWEYERGTWQYDLLATLIILLLFFSPRGFSRSRIHLPHQPGATANPAGPVPDSTDSAQPKASSTVHNATQQLIQRDPLRIP